MRISTRQFRKNLLEMWHIANMKPGTRIIGKVDIKQYNETLREIYQLLYNAD